MLTVGGFCAAKRIAQKVTTVSNPIERLVRRLVHCFVISWTFPLCTFVLLLINLLSLATRYFTGFGRLNLSGLCPTRKPLNLAHFGGRNLSVYCPTNVPTNLPASAASPTNLPVCFLAVALAKRLVCKEQPRKPVNIWTIAPAIKRLINRFSATKLRETRR